MYWGAWNNREKIISHKTGSQVDSQGMEDVPGPYSWRSRRTEVLWEQLRWERLNWWLSASHLTLSCAHGYSVGCGREQRAILPPSLPRLFSPHWARNSGWGQKLYTLYKQSTKAAVHWLILRSVWELRGTLFTSFVLVSVNSAVWGKAYCAGQCFLLTQVCACNVPRVEVASERMFEKG